MSIYANMFSIEDNEVIKIKFADNSTHGCTSVADIVMTKESLPIIAEMIAIALRNRNRFSSAADVIKDQLNKMEDETK